MFQESHLFISCPDMAEPLTLFHAVMDIRLPLPTQPTHDRGMKIRAECR